MADDKDRYQRVADDDPTRCHAVNVGPSGDQCHLKAVPNGTFCPLHGGIIQENVAKKHALANYRLQQYSERVGELANNSEIKSLREEIGITRMVLETVLNKCEDANKLLVYSDKITTLVGQISRLIEVSQKLEERNNNLLDRGVVIVIADSIVTLIGQYIDNPDVLMELGTKICESITTAASPKDSARAISQEHN
jgi:hypothetical protein